MRAWRLLTWVPGGPGQQHFLGRSLRVDMAEPRDREAVCPGAIRVTKTLSFPHCAKGKGMVFAVRSHFMEGVALVPPWFEAWLGTGAVAGG